MTISNTPTWLNSRARTVSVTTIVFHATAGKSGASSISWLRQIGLSYHYVIERDGRITKAVPVSRVAFHAGKSVGPNGPNVNAYSIGIAFANLDDGKEAITPAQLTAAHWLVLQIVKELKDVRFVTTHKRISPGRKMDPRLFNASEFVASLGETELEAW